MNLVYILLFICLALTTIILVMYFSYRDKEPSQESDTPNELIPTENSSSYFPAIKIVEDDSIVPSSRSLIKNDNVKSALATLDNVAIKSPATIKSSKNALELAKNNKVLFSAKAQDAKHMLKAGKNKYYGVKVSDETNLFTGQTKFTKETGLVKSIKNSEITSAGMNAASMVVGQYYMSEINDELAAMKASIDKISSFQTAEYKGKVLSIVSKIDEVIQNQDDILANEETRKNSYQDIKDIEHKCTELLGQANSVITDNIKDKEMNAKEYFDKLKYVDEWYNWQQFLELLLLKIADLRYTLANGSEKASLSHHLFNYYLDITDNVNSKLALWHNNYINKLGIDINNYRKKGSLFKVREKTIGLINEDWNYNKIAEDVVNQITAQISPKKYDKLLTTKKADVILIQKYKGNYYNVTNNKAD